MVTLCFRNTLLNWLEISQTRRCSTIIFCLVTIRALNRGSAQNVTKKYCDFHNTWKNIPKMNPKYLPPNGPQQRGTWCEKTFKFSKCQGCLKFKEIMNSSQEMEDIPQMTLSRRRAQDHVKKRFGVLTPE